MANVSTTTNATSNTTTSTSSAAPTSTRGHDAATGGGMSATNIASGASTGAQSSLSTLVASKDVKNFTLAPPTVDVRGWNVTLSTGATVGVVDRIMLDSRDHAPRYLAVTPSDRKGHMLLPIGLGTLDREQKRVVLQHLKPELLKTLPLLTTNVVTRDIERSIFGVVKGAKITDQTMPQIYTDPLYDAARLFGGKAAPTGA